jgi:hypothetical protein
VAEGHPLRGDLGLEASVSSPFRSAVTFLAKRSEHQRSRGQVL